MGLLQSKKSFAMEIATKPLVMASEIAGLEPLRGYIKQENLVLSAQFAYPKPRQKRRGFIERQVSISPRPVSVQPSPQVVTTAVPVESLKKPVKKQLVFPGTSRQKAANEKPRDWDKLEWIE